MNTVPCSYSIFLVFLHENSLVSVITYYNLNTFQTYLMWFGNCTGGTKQNFCYPGRNLYVVFERLTKLSPYKTSFFSQKIFCFICPELSYPRFKSMFSVRCILVKFVQHTHSQYWCLYTNTAIFTLSSANRLITD